MCVQVRIMDVTTKTFDQVVREFEIMEMELEIKMKEIIGRIQKKATHEKPGQWKPSVEYIEWEKQNDQSLARNRDFIKDLEFMKAKLRSRYYYQPATNHFDDRVKKFKLYARNKPNKNNI